MESTGEAALMEYEAALDAYLWDMFRVVLLGGLMGILVTTYE